MAPSGRYLAFRLDFTNDRIATVAFLVEPDEQHFQKHLTLSVRSDAD